MAIVIEGNISIGGNISITGDVGPGFTLSPSDFTTWSYGSYLSIPNTSGFTTSNAGVGPGEAFWGPQFGAVQSPPSPAKRSELLAYWASNGLTTNGNAYMFNVTWGAGSTLSSGEIGRAHV